MTYTLVELPVPAQCHSGLVTAVYSVNVITFDLLYVVHCDIASKGNLNTHQGVQEQFKTAWLQFKNMNCL